MEPVVFGKKRALLVKPNILNKHNPNKNNRHSEIIENLRTFISVRSWEREKNNWTYETLQKIKENPYIMRAVPEKRNKKGNIIPCSDYFFLLTTIQNRRICCFIEKKKPLENAMIYQIRSRFKDELFKGTLLQGTFLMSEENQSLDREEIRYYFSKIFKSINREISSNEKKKNWLYIASDILAANGKDMSSLLPQRLVFIQDLIGRDWYPDSKLDVCDFDIAIYNNYNSIEDFLRNKRKYYSYQISDHNVVIVNTQGVPGIDEYFMSLKAPIPKPLLGETVTFKNGEWDFKNTDITNYDNDKNSNKTKELFLKMSDYPDVYWVYDPTNMKKLGPARVRTMNESKKLKKLFQNNMKNDYLKLTFKWMQEFEKWQPILKNI